MYILHGLKWTFEDTLNLNGTRVLISLWKQSMTSGGLTPENWEIYVGGNSSFATMIDCEPNQRPAGLWGWRNFKNIGDEAWHGNIEKCFWPACRMALIKNTRQNEHHKNLMFQFNNKQITLVPVISWVQAGAWKEVGYSEVDFEHSRNLSSACTSVAKWLIFQGDWWFNDWWVPPRDMIFVDPEKSSARYGDDVIALMHDTGETTFKWLIEDGTQRYLKALNPNWPEPLH